MATMLGKRKRDTVRVSKTEVGEQANECSAASDSESGLDELDAQEIFRRHFEAQYAPLAASPKKPKVIQQVSEDESEDATDWEGISDEEEEKVQVIEHTDAQPRMAAMSKEELKSFMVRDIPHPQSSIANQFSEF
jgi:hypothetical protein